MSRELSKDKPVVTQTLRERAEKLLHAKQDNLTAMSTMDLKALVYELSVHQMELEVQNEELRQAQVELAQAHDHYSDLYEFAPVGYISLKKDGEIIGANLTAAGMLGVKRQELLHTKLTKFIARPSQDDFYLYRQAVFSSSIKQTREIEMHKADATALSVRLESIVPRLEQEQVCQTVLVDITERKKAEYELQRLLDSLEQQVDHRTQQLRDEHRFIDTILENMPAATMVLDVDARVISFNKACETASGYSFQEMRGTTKWKNLVPPDERQRLGDMISSFQAREYDSVQHENHWVHKDGSRRLFCWYNTVLKDSAGQVQYLIGSGLDITAQREAEVENDKHLEEAARLQRVLTANELATNLAHELNQPLAAISMTAENSQALLEPSPLEPGQDRQLIENLQHISDQAMRGGEIVRGLMAMVRKSKIDAVSLDLNAVIRTACGLIQKKAERRNIKISLNLDKTLPPVMGVSVHIEQVLLNLLRNGIDAIRDRGSQGGHICVENSRQESMVLVTVCDSGGGIDEQVIDSLFESFFSTKDYGLGVGLRISHSLVEAMGGRLWAEVHQSEGIFHFELPLAP
ncbi:MAG: PAS domain S-box protein [Lysobacterales bacterium]